MKARSLFKLTVIPAIFFFAFLSKSLLNAQNSPVNFNYNNTVGCSPLKVGFTDLTPKAVSWRWDFGNGSTSVLQNPSTVYLNKGKYTVKLFVTKSTGAVDSLVRTELISVVDIPEADFSCGKTQACLGENEFSFMDASAGANKWLWDFGDGNYSTLRNPVHSYTAPGKYTIKLIADNGYNCTDVKVMSNYIEIFPDPSAEFSSSKTLGCNYSDVYSFTPQDASAVQWKWDFGNGAGSALQNPGYSYNTTGYYTVSLIAQNKFGCLDTVIKKDYINIYSFPSPVFFSNITDGCAPLSVSFKDTTKMR